MTLQVLQEALKLQPSAVREACLLAQLYMMGGQPEDALETARAVREAAPADSDAHGLFVLLSEAEGPTSETVTELSQAYLELLTCDPASEHALQGNTPLHTIWQSARLRTAGLTLCILLITLGSELMLLGQSWLSPAHAWLVIEGHFRSNWNGVLDDNTVWFLGVPSLMHT